MRDRASYAFALVSVAAALDSTPDGKITARGSRSAAWRTNPGARSKAEKALVGKTGRTRRQLSGRRGAKRQLAAAQKGLRGLQRISKSNCAKRSIVRALSHAWRPKYEIATSTLQADQYER